jgi:pimeloyl-ACP methyl ester carboxylesterase
MTLEVITETPRRKTHNTPLLFVHGAWHGAWCWQEHFLPKFAQVGYECHAVSVRGHGHSPIDRSLSFVSVMDYVSDIADVAFHLGVPPVLIGHSLGGLVVQKYLETHAAPAGVLMASVPVKGLTIKTVLRIILHDPVAFLQTNLKFDLYPIVSTRDRARWGLFSEGIAPDRLDSYFQRLQSESYLAFLEALYLWPNTSKVQAPLLVLGAQNDNIFHRDQIEATARAYHTTATIFPNMAHDMMLEPDWHLVADHIISWLIEQRI